MSKIIFFVFFLNIARLGNFKGIAAGNFQPEISWDMNEDSEPALNIDEYSSVDEYELYDDIKNQKNNHNKKFEKNVSTVANTKSKKLNTGLRMTRTLKNISRNAFDTVKLMCEVSGYPPPAGIKWYKNEAPVKTSKGKIVTKVLYGENSVSSRLRIISADVHDSGFYKCVSTNGIQTVFSNGVLVINPELMSPPVSIGFPNYDDFQSNIHSFKPLSTSNGVESSPKFTFSTSQVYPYPVCEPYNGTRCSKYLNKNYVHIAPNTSQQDIERMLENAIKVVNHSKDLSKGCAIYAIPTLCYTALPLCKNLHNYPIPEQICKEDCEMLENDICRVEYAIAKRHNLIGPIISLSDCATLPSTECRHLGLTLSEPIDESATCYWGYGAGYRGTASTSVSGKNCVKWNQQMVVKTSEHAELLGGHSYCRNPGDDYTLPWCFVDSESGPKREFCAVPKCDDTKFLYMIVACCLIIMIGLLFLLRHCCNKRNRVRRRSNQMPSPKFKHISPKGNMRKIKEETTGSGSAGCRSQLEMSSLIPSSSTPSSQRSDTRSFKVTEFHVSCIKFEEELGEGAFGKVYKGELMLGDGQYMSVAIKTLKENANPKTVGEFKREVDLMSELRHPNIVSLLGVCLSNRLCMLFEYMVYGDLHEFLLCHSPTYDGPRKNINAIDRILEQEDLMHISIQISAGMEYLCNQHFVHRDLATRNCLVGNNMAVKISDFGLSRDVYSSDYYRVQKSALLPIRWMSPESILYGKFTVESDVWSYGVILWEIYSYGLQPYFSHSNPEVVEMIRSHQVLSCPEGCPPRMYALMVECWNQVPSRRPHFSEIYGRLIQWRDNYSGSDITDSSQVSHHQNQIHRRKDQRNPLF